MRSERQAGALLLIGPAALLLGAYGFQYLGGLAPCEMCWWQRYALMATLALALAGALAGFRPALLLLAALALLANAGLALFHVGVEQHWWQGITACASTAAGSLTDILAQPLVRCDAIPWSLAGISMAGWNGIVSLAVGGLALWRLRG